MRVIVLHRHWRGQEKNTLNDNTVIKRQIHPIFDTRLKNNGRYRLIRRLYKRLTI